MSERYLKKSNRAKSAVTFNTLGSGYSLPVRDHRFKITHGLKFGEFGTKPTPKSFMSQVVNRAKSSIAPSKYALQFDWGKRSKVAPNYVIPKAKRITLADEMIIAKKKIPAPSYYKNEGLTPKVFGFYGNTESKCSVIGTTAYEKKFIPGPNAYESRGKSMAELVKEKAKAFNFHPELKYTKSSHKYKKTNDPAPTSYEVAPAIEKSAKMRESIKSSIPHAKNANFISK